MKEGDKLFIKPKMGIIPEVTKQNYETIAKQLREVITNAIDANAKKISLIIQPDGENTDLLISDDGIGMDEEVFKEQFLALGGSEKYYEEEQIGRIGIGFLACAPLCKYMDIYTRSKDTNIAFIVRLNTEHLLSRSIRLENIEKFPVGEVIEVIEDADSVGLDLHYTQVILKELNPEVVKVLNDEKKYTNLMGQLRKILPLKFPRKSKLFKYISEDLKQILIKESDTWNADVFFNGEPLIKRVYGQEPGENFKYVMELIQEKAGIGKVSGYFIDNGVKIKNWNGLISRFQNTTVEDSGFLDWNKRPAALIKVTGELFISGLDKNTSIVINRNSFNEADIDYIQLRDLIYEKLDTFTSRVYRRSYISSAVKKEINKKMAIKDGLRKISLSISEPKKKRPKPVQKKLVKTPIKKEKATDLSEIKIAKRFGDVEVKIVDKVPKEGRSKKNYSIEWKGEDGTEPIVLIGKDLLKETGEDLRIEERLFKVYFIEDENDLLPCKIDFDKNEVLFNTLHPTIKKKDDKIISFIFLLTYFYNKTKTKEEYKNKLIDGLSDLS